VKVLELVNIKRKDTHLYYRREFTADVVLEYLQQTVSSPVEFTLEHKPLGGVDIRVALTEDLDYPVLPVVSKLKHLILDLHSRGSLP